MKIYKPSGKNECYFTRRINNESITSFKWELEKTNWQEVINSNDCEESYKLFMKTFHEVYNHSFPIKKVTVKERRMKANPWISKGIVKSSKHEFKLYENFIKNPSKENEEKYKTNRNKPIIIW